ncbi:MAG TPA: radical SAM family heme chaperone HemW [Gammaproteobacteria bacterium]|nr:radical SAM family heme chaperone HemW [Gammaproteobacteria bacterium]
MTVLPPLSLYVHLPWCVSKCPYCDFNSHALKTALPERGYVDALLRDLDLDLPRVSGRRIESVFFGGGTPSLFSAAAIARLLEEIRCRIAFAPDAEITLEANPGSVEHGRFAEYKAAGVTRLSIGIQSFNPRHLEKLGRIHSADDALHAAGEAHAAGLDNFNLDLMYGLSGQTLDQATADVRQAIALAPAHLSHYQLTLEPNTLFHAHPPPLPEDDSIWAMQQACQALMQDRGFAQYEISAYATSGRRCRHNLNYWRFGDYLGIGAGAHAKLTDIDGTRWRMWKLKHPASYLRDAGSPSGIGGINVVTAEELGFEFMLNRLRLVERFTETEFETASGQNFDSVRPAAEQAVALGLMAHDGGEWQVTSRGHTYLNELQQLFLPATR